MYTKDMQLTVMHQNVHPPTWKIAVQAPQEYLRARVKNRAVPVQIYNNVNLLSGQQGMKRFLDEKADSIAPLSKNVKRSHFRSLCPIKDVKIHLRYGS